MKKNYISAIVLGLALLVSCTPDPISTDKAFLSEDAAKEIVSADAGKVYTLNEFLDTYMTEKGNYKSDSILYRTRANKGDGIWLFSIDTLPSTGNGIYIRGRITTDDYGGNFYKAICIQQIVDGKQQALRISVDASSVSGMYPLGQEILIRCNGLAIGRYSDQPQLCVPTYSNNNTAMNGEQKCGWAPGRIPWPRFQEAVTRIGTPDPSKLVYEEVRISDFTNLTGEDNFRKWDAKLVKLSNVWFTGQYNDGQNATISAATCSNGDPEADQNANVFAPTTDNIGFPQSRIITDGNDLTLVSCSEYAKFAHFYLPGCSAAASSAWECDQWTGTVTGILGFYRDNASKPSGFSDGSALPANWSITLRDINTPDREHTVNDIQLTRDGKAWVPQEYGTL